MYHFRFAVGISAYGIHFSSKFVNFNIFGVAAIKEAAAFVIILLIVPFFKMVRDIIILSVWSWQFQEPWLHYFLSNQNIVLGKTCPVGNICVLDWRNSGSNFLCYTLRSNYHPSCDFRSLSRFYVRFVLRHWNFHSRSLFYWYQGHNLQFFGGN